MNTYNFYIDELNQIWSRIYIKVDADTKEEAIKPENFVKYYD